ncbi:hypothetical protein WJX77_010703 [Trebouxia sp. C0004]
MASCMLAGSCFSSSLGISSGPGVLLLLRPLDSGCPVLLWHFWTRWDKADVVQGVLLQAYLLAVAAGCWGIQRGDLQRAMCSQLLVDCNSNPSCSCALSFSHVWPWSYSGACCDAHFSRCYEV